MVARLTTSRYIDARTRLKDALKVKISAEDPEAKGPPELVAIQTLVESKAEQTLEEFESLVIKNKLQAARGAYWVGVSQGLVASVLFVLLLAFFGWGVPWMIRASAIDPYKLLHFWDKPPASPVK